MEKELGSDLDTRLWTPRETRGELPGLQDDKGGVHLDNRLPSYGMASSGCVSTTQNDPRRKGNPRDVRVPQPLQKRDRHHTTHGDTSTPQKAPQELALALPTLQDSTTSAASASQSGAADQDLCRSDISSEILQKYSLSSPNEATEDSAEQSDQRRCATQTSVHLQACL